MRPVLFKIGSFEVHSFGLVMVVAFLAAIWLLQRRADRYGISKDQVSDLTFYTLISGVLGARIVFIAQEWGYYSTHTKELLSLQFQGLTSFGGLIFGAIAVMVWGKLHRVSIGHLLDFAAPAFILAHAIGRFGCLMNGCCFGGACPAELPWGIHVEHSSVLHHPAQVYDSLMNFAVLSGLLFMERRQLRVGQLLGATLALHGLTRFIYEFWRAGTVAQVTAGEASSTYWGNLPITEAQGMAAVLMVVGIVIYALVPNRAPNAVQPSPQG